MFRYRRNNLQKKFNNGNENNGVTYITQRESELMKAKDNGNQLKLVKFGKNEGSAELIEKFCYLDVSLASVKLLHSLFNTIVEKSNKTNNFTSMDISNVMSEIIPSKFMKTDEFKEEKLEKSASSWDKIFSKCCFMNQFNNEKDEFYMIGSIALPDRVAKKTNRVPYFQVNINNSSGRQTAEAFKEIQRVVSGHERDAKEIVQMILEEANEVNNPKGMHLRSDEDKKPVVNVVIINPHHNFERNMLQELSENKDIHIIKNEEIYSIIEQYEFEIESKRENEIMKNLERIISDVSVNEQKERNRREVQANDHIRSTVLSMSTQKLKTEIDTVLKSRGSSSLLDFWEVFMDSSLQLIFSPTDNMDPNIHIQKYITKLDDEATAKVGNASNDYEYIRAMKDIVDVLDDLRDNWLTLKECSIVPMNELDGLKYERLVTSVINIAKCYKANQSRWLLLEDKIKSNTEKALEENVNCDINKLKWYVIKAEINNAVMDSTNASPSRNRNNNGTVVLQTHVQHKRNSDLPVVSREELKKMLVNARRTFSVTKLNDNKRYETREKWQAIIQNVRSQCKISEVSLPRRWCHFCGGDHLMKDCN